MLKKAAAVGLSFVLLSAPMLANEDDGPRGIPHLDHVFVILMENHGYQQVIDNPNEPFLNSLIANKKVNLATNYFAVGTSQPDQLPGNRRRIEFRSSQRQSSGLA